MLLKIFVWLLLLSASSGDDNFVFNGFRGAKLSLDGPALITPDGLLKLNNATKHEKSHAFYTAPVSFKHSPAGNVVSFSTSFVFVIIPEYATMGSSGFTFVLSPSKDFSAAFSNQFFGLFNSTNNGDPLNHILAVEFDTVLNPEIGDINANHVGIDINGVRSNKSVTAGYLTDVTGGFKNLSLISGDPMQVWIEYDSVEMQINVTLSPINMPKPNLPLLSSTLNLSSIILDSMYVGFSSTTTAIYSYHYILGWSFKMNGKAQALDLSRLPPVPRMFRSSNAKHIALTIWLPLIVSLLVLVILACVRYVLMRKNKFSELLEDWELDFGPHRFSYKELYEATKGFKDKNLLGVGGFGRVYRGILPSSRIEVAVKRVSHESKQGVREFVAEIVSIGKLRHRNVVQLLGYCRRKGELLLVYDFMPKGSLDKFLFHQDKPTLCWNQRLQIIKGVASGLLYLHEDWEQVVIHRDVKAGNVLLDNDMNGKLGDFGLARLYNHGTAPKTTHVVGTTGYLAPEFAKNCKPTTSTDVFAFGVFILEVACGRRPIELSKHESEQILVDWVYGNWRKGTILETRDPRYGEKYIVEELEMVLKLGLFCSHPMPSARPSIRQVVQLLDGDIPLPHLSPDHSANSDPEFIQSKGFCDYLMAYPSLVSST